MSQPDPDPRIKYPTPPYPEQDQAAPGADVAMTVQADHGEKSYRGSGKLEGKTALITGADSGIGRAVALAFAREGADVLISYLNEDEDARETARLVEEAGRRAVLAPGDIGDEAHCQALVERVRTEFGGWTCSSTTLPTKGRARTSPKSPWRNSTAPTGPTSSPCFT